MHSRVADALRATSYRLRSVAAAGTAVALAFAAVGADAPEQIVVTARKLPELRAAVPLAIDVVADDGAEPGMGSLQDLIGQTPGLYFESTWGGALAAPTLRGQQAGPTGDINVGVFVDGVYQANATSIDAAPIDVARVEVVRGPQSALFGHSTFAGAIHYVSRAPTPTFESGFTVEAGSAGLAGAEGHVSGPLFAGALLGRVAVAARTYDGTQRNAAGGNALGGVRRSSVALQLASPPGDGFAASVAARLGDSRYAQPAVASVTYLDYDCGAIEPTSGAWSYYCSEIPLGARFDSSPQIPESRNDVGQLAVTLSWPVASGTLTSLSTYYRGRNNVYRDFDASSGGERFGVCTIGVTCVPTTGTRPVNRLVQVDEVWRAHDVATEWSEELRFARTAGGRLRWSVGVVAWHTETHEEAALGATRGDLAADERLTAFLPLSPTLAGPQSLMNFAVVADPNTQQVTSVLDLEDRDTVAAFGTLDVVLGAHFDARLEARSTRERRALENRTASFVPGFGTAIAPARFRDVTPRISLRYAASQAFSMHLSAAKGSQSGGINARPGLLPEEQTYDPEYNWTYELAAHYRSPQHGVGIEATLYSIDWYDTQLLGFSQTPGVNGQITRNTAGIRTRGIEVSLDARPVPVLYTRFGLSWADPEFRTGSDDLGSSRFCGLSRTNLVSTFCTVGPSRSGGTTVVPYIDDNVPARVPRRMWHTAFEITPQAFGGRLAVRVDANGQDDVFDRAVNGARFGERTLLDLRLSYDFGSWSIALWGRNLGDEQYVRALSSRGQVYFPTVPRPLDAIYGDERRFGVSATFDAPR